MTEAMVQWDVFVSYASEDRPFVEKLAAGLTDRRLRVWFDQFELRVGDKIFRKINEGISRSRYGIVVLSPNFFEKEFPQKELEALFRKEDQGGTIILPIWYNVTIDDVRAVYPLLVDIWAAVAGDDIDEVLNQILRAIEPDVVTKDELTAMLDAASFEQRTEILLGTLAKYTHPRSYRVHIAEGNAVSEQLRKIRDQLKLPEDYFRSYAKLLGFPKDHGPQLFKTWLKDLEDDPWWWYKKPMKSYLDQFLGGTSEPVPMLQIRVAAEIEDFDEVVVICKDAYRASLVIKNRDNFLNTLDAQPNNIQQEVFKGWVEMIVRGKTGDWTKVASDKIEAFKTLQRMSSISLEYISWPEEKI